MGRRFDSRFDRRDQAVAALRYRLDVTRLLRIIAERLAQLDDRLRERVVADHDSRPDEAEQLVARDHPPGPEGQLPEDLDRLRFQVDRFASAAKLVQLDVELPLSDPQGAVHRPRSEERRVGKEWQSWGSPD